MSQSTSISTRLQAILPRTPEDPKDLRDAFEGGKLLPYAGNSAKSNHTFASLLEDLCVFSNSRGTVHEDIASYAFGGEELEVRYYNRSGFKRENGREVTEAEVEAYSNALQEIGIDASSLKIQAEQLFKSYACYGCAFLLNDYVRLGDAKEVNTRATGVDSTILFDDDGIRYAIYFPHGIKNVKPNDKHFIYRVFSSANEVLDAIESSELERDEGLGVYRYAFHLRNGNSTYGRPKDIQAIREMLTEAGMALHDEKVSIAPTTARGIITYPVNETKNEDIEVPANRSELDGTTSQVVRSAESEFKEMAKHTRKTLDKEDLGFMPFSGSVEPNLLKLDIARDAKYRTIIDQITTRKIYSANRWSTELTGATSPSGGIGSGYFKDLVAFKNQTTIRGYQKLIAEFQNKAISVPLNDEQFVNMIHAFPDPLASLEFSSGVANEAM